MSLSITQKFLGTIQEFSLLEKGETILVAVSGGADSVALLHLLNAIKDNFNLKLQVAHLNHMTRKVESDLDMRYVQDLAQKLGLPIAVEYADVQAYAHEKKMGVEEAGRELRYHFFEKAADKIGADRIAVGHTADDNVETFLMRLLRGSGLKGLCGIPVKRGRIVRPLIQIWRKEIEDYVGGLKIVPRRDHTNYESKYMRNRVRLKLIPQLKIYNLNIKDVILQTVLLLTEDREYLNRQVEGALGKIVVDQKIDEITLDITALKKLALPLQGHVLRMAIEKVKGDLSELSYAHVRGILGNLGASEKWEQHLPGSVFVLGSRGRLLISRERPRQAVHLTYSYTVTVPGEVAIKETGNTLRASVVDLPAEEEITSGAPSLALVDYEVLGKEITVRSKNDGDRFVPLGMQGTKKLQDFFIDEKIPQELRDAIPIVESRGKIIWVAGMRLDERAKVRKNTEKAVKLELL